MKHTIINFLLMVFFFGLSAGMAFASPLTAKETFNQFNLVVLGDATSHSDVDGRAYIGGNLSGGDYVQHPASTPASSYAGLTVGGNASGVQTHDGAVVEGNLSSSTINSGNAVVFGTATNSSFNGGYKYYIGANGGGNNLNGTADSALKNGTAAQAATSTDFGSVLTSLSTQLEGLTSNSSIDITSLANTAIFNATPDGNGVAVFDVSAADLQQGQFEFNLNGATTVILNSDATDPTIRANFIGSYGAQSIGPKTIWNFFDATGVNIQNQFGGSILAPNAYFTNQNNIEGGVYANTLGQGGEIHLQPFSGNIPSSPVPEPSTLLLLGVGLFGLVAVNRKIRARSS